MRVVSLLRLSGALLALGLMVLANAPTATAATYLKGIDVSHHNGQPDWGQVNGDGVTFAIAKVSEDVTFTDDEYARNKQQAEAQGIAFTGYHFARPDKVAGDAVAEADYFLDHAMLTGKNLVPVLDLEDSGGLGVRALTRWTKDWLGRVRTRLGVKAIIYTGPFFWQDHMGNSRWFADNGYRLWIAHHTTASQPMVPASNWGGRGWTLWQYSNDGAVAGIAGPVDMDRYAGTGLGPLKIKNNR